MTTTRPAEPGEDVLRDYGTSAGKVEPGGIERVPVEDRHGKPWHLFTTWMSPNLEFATVFVGVIGVLFFGLSFWQAVAAVLIGNALGSTTHGILSAWGPRHGLAQMVLSRTAFGYWGNLLPATLMSLMAGVGWFAVNSISGAYALATLLPISPRSRSRSSSSPRSSSPSSATTSSTSSSGSPSPSSSSPSSSPR